jgi:hypothetical protein
MSNDKIADALGIENEVPVPAIPATVEVKSTAQDEIEDYELNRATLRSLIEKGTTAMDTLLQLSIQSQAVDSFETTATMIKTLADVTNTLKKLHEKSSSTAKRMSHAEMEQVPTQVNNIDKAVFVGTTAQLLKDIKKSREAVETEE